MSNKTFALLVEKGSDKYFSGSTFISNNNTIFQIVRDIEFSPEIIPNNTYDIKLISYNNKKEFMTNREKFSYVATFNYNITYDDIELIKKNNKLYKESISYINNIKYNLGMFFSYYIDEQKNIFSDTKYIYFMSHPFLSIS
jgi:hypothetical protein